MGKCIVLPLLLLAIPVWAKGPEQPKLCLTGTVKLIASRVKKQPGDTYGLPAEIAAKVDFKALDELSDALLVSLLGGPRNIRDLPIMRGYSDYRVRDRVVGAALNRKMDSVFQSPFLRVVEQGLPVEKVFISTHQSEHLQPQVLSYLKESGAAEKFPYLQLYAESLYNNRIPENLEGSPLIRYSASGEIRGAKLNMGEVHVFGGSFGSCLSRTVVDAANQTLDFPGRRETLIVVHGAQSYTTDGKKSVSKHVDGLPERAGVIERVLDGLSSRFPRMFRGSDKPYIDRVQYLERHLNPLHESMGSDPDFNYQGYRVIPNPTGQPQVELTFRRRSDGKIARVRAIWD